MKTENLGEKPPKRLKKIIIKKSKAEVDDFDAQIEKVRKPKKQRTDDKRIKKYSKSNKRLDRFGEIEDDFDDVVNLDDDDDDDGQRPRLQRKAPLNKQTPAKQPPLNPKKNLSDGIRLNRYISNSGVCSRREADEYIKSGIVKVNGKVVTEMGVNVSIKDLVEVNGKKISPEKKVYIIMNKPKNFITTTHDAHADKTVMDLLNNKVEERVYPVGRLDRNTTGVLLLTNDGELAKTLTHPKYNKKKIYHAFLDKPIQRTDLEKLVNGVELDDGIATADAVDYPEPNDKTQIGIEIHSGRNRIVRRMLEHLGFQVEKLDRVYFAGLTKKGLTRGQWRFLTERELNILYMKNYD